MLPRLLIFRLVIAAFAAALGAAPAFAEIVDRIVATVGKRVITLSDVQSVHRFESLVNQLPLRPLDDARIREVALRLIDQALIEQEMAAAAGRPASVPKTEIERQMAELRKNFAQNGDFRQALEKYGLDEQQVFGRLELQSTLARFIEARFRPGVQVDEAAIEGYYRETLLPELRAQAAREIPALDQVRDQIEEILAQQRINRDSAAWLKDLRGQTPVRFR